VFHPLQSINCNPPTLFQASLQLINQTVGDALSDMLLCLAALKVCLCQFCFVTCSFIFTSVGVEHGHVVVARFVHGPT
jgi:hypothetical protein